EAYNYLRVDVDGGTLAMRVTGVDGKEIERFALRPQPVIFNGGVVRNGEYASIFGRNLAVRPEAASGDPAPLELGGVRVQLDGRDIPLLYVSPRQVNVRIPDDSQGSGALQIFTENGAARANV